MSLTKKPVFPLVFYVALFEGYSLVNVALSDKPCVFVAFSI